MAAEATETCPAPSPARAANAPAARRATPRHRKSALVEALQSERKLRGRPAARRGQQDRLSARARPRRRLPRAWRHIASPWTELARGRTVAPRLTRAIGVPAEPSRPPELVVRLDQVGTKRQRAAEERFGVGVHLARRIQQAEVEMRVQRRLAVTGLTDRAGQVLDRLAVDRLLEADVADVHAGDRVRRFPLQDRMKLIRARRRTSPAASAPSRAAKRPASRQAPASVPSAVPLRPTHVHRARSGSIPARCASTR